MEFLIFIGIVGLFLYFLNQNKTEKKDQTTITHKKVIQTKDGEVLIERRQVIDSVRTSYTKNDIANTAIENIQPVITHTSTKQIEAKIEPKTMEKQSFALELSTKPVGQNGLFDQPQPTKPPDIEPTKVCPKCEKALNDNAFSKSSKYEDGLTKWCTRCLNQLNEDRKTEGSNKKTCPHCKRTRLKTSFYKNSKQNDGLTKWCKGCMDKAKR